MHITRQWGFLTSQYGNWNSVYKRFARWCEQGVWQRMLAHFADDPDMEYGIVDSPIVRAHPCAAGAQNKGTQDEQALGRSRGGFSTKLPHPDGWLGQSTAHPSDGRPVQ